MIAMIPAYKCTACGTEFSHQGQGAHCPQCNPQLTAQDAYEAVQKERELRRCQGGAAYLNNDVLAVIERALIKSGAQK